MLCSVVSKGTVLFVFSVFITKFALQVRLIEKG